jgi:hypothetical protein
MSEILVSFADPVASRAGDLYMVRACGRPTAGGTWEGWLEFVPVDGGPVVRSGRETTQPGREDAEYWATGLTPVYLEGALERALTPVTTPEVVGAPAFDGPAPSVAGRSGVPAEPPGVGESVLNPFSVYRKGEDVLRRQLGALSAWHLVNIIRDYELSDQDPATLSSTPDDVLIELIVSQVRALSSE